MIAHTRQLRAAMRSHESAQKGKDNGFAPAMALLERRMSGMVIVLSSFMISVHNTDIVYLR
jgi:hypothetical protein